RTCCPVGVRAVGRSSAPPVLTQYTGPRNLDLHPDGSGGGGPGESAPQARIVRKLGLQPFELGTGFPLAAEGVERVRREPAPPDAERRGVGNGPEPAEDGEGGRPIAPIPEQGLRRQPPDPRGSPAAPRRHLPPA